MCRASVTPTTALKASSPTTIVPTTAAAAEAKQHQHRPTTAPKIEPYVPSFPEVSVQPAGISLVIEHPLAAAPLVLEQLNLQIGRLHTKKKSKDKDQIRTTRRARQPFRNRTAAKKTREAASGEKTTEKREQIESINARSTGTYLRGSTTCCGGVIVLPTTAITRNQQETTAAVAVAVATPAVTLAATAAPSKASHQQRNGN